MQNKIIEHARDWIGTPYQHQGYLRGLACDCVGLVLAVGRELSFINITHSELLKIWNYGRLPNPVMMLATMEKFLTRSQDEELKEGDILLIEWKPGYPMHLAIYTGNKTNTIIHAYRVCGFVCEQRLDKLWKGRINSVWRYRGL